MNEERQKSLVNQQVSALTSVYCDDLDVELPADLSAPLLDPVAGYLDGLKSPRSRSTMEDALKRAARAAGLGDGFRGWWALRPDQLDRVRRALIEHHQPSTVSLSLVALRGVLKMAWRLGLITHEQYARDVDWGKGPRGSRLLAGRCLKPDELQKLAAYTGDLPGSYGKLSRACFGAMLGGALRAFEVCGLVHGAYDVDARSFRVVGKGDKEAMQSLQSEPAAQAVVEWLAIRKEMTASAPWLFLRVNNERASRAEMLTVKWLEHHCLMVARGAGIDRFSPHDCRRTFATLMLDGGVDLATVQRLMRHESSATTAKYDRRQATADAAAARSVPALFDPYG